MEGSQSRRQGDGGAASTGRGDKGRAASELDEKMGKIDMKPPQSTLGLLAKNAALLPSGILRVKQPSGAAASCTGSATGNPRNKTALAPGHSLMDWIRLGSSGVDLTGVGGRLLAVTPTELARHNREDDAWIAIRGIVFNVSRYMSFHPGGVPELMKGVGKDATKLFDDVHAWVNYQSILQKCVVGRLERSVNVDLFLESEKANKSISESAPKAAKPDLKMDWRQTTSGVSLLYAPDSPVGECALSRLAEAECALALRLESETLTHRVRLSAGVEWPPNWRSSGETPEVEIAFRKKERGLWKTYGTHTASREQADASKRTYREYEVLENTPLCKIVQLLILRAHDYIQVVPPGRHVEVKTDVMGTEVSRLYTPVPSCLHPEDRPAAATADDCLCLMVKRYEDGAMSPKLTSLRPGDKLDVSNSLGEFAVGEYDRYEALHMLAAGSGLTAMLSILKRALARRNPPSVNLINFNRDEDSIFYRSELERVSGERTLKVTHVLSAAESSTWSGRTGTASEELLRELVGERSAKACVFTCGPAGFMKAAAESLRELGWEASQMFEFDG